MLVGDSRSGKSSIMMRFAEDVFSDHTFTTIGVDFRLKTINIGGLRCKLQIWDTTGAASNHSSF